MRYKVLIFIFFLSLLSKGAVAQFSDTLCYGDSVVYFIPPVPETSYYIWSYTGLYDKLEYDSTELLQPNCNLIPLNSGILSVTAHNYCGVSIERVLEVIVYEYGSLVWNGSVNTNWFRAENWNQPMGSKQLGCHMRIPGPNTYVELLQTAPNQPIINIDSAGIDSAACRSIYLRENDTLTFRNYAQTALNKLYITGDLLLDGNIIFENDSNLMVLQCDTGEIVYGSTLVKSSYDHCRSCIITIDTGAEYIIEENSAEAKILNIDSIGKLIVDSSIIFNVFDLNVLTEGAELSIYPGATLNIAGEVSNHGEMDVVQGTVYYNNGTDLWDSIYVSQTVVPVSDDGYGILVANGGRKDQGKTLTVGDSNNIKCQTFILINQDYESQVVTASNIVMIGGGDITIANNVNGERLTFDLMNQMVDTTYTTTFTLGDSGIINIHYSEVTENVKAINITDGDLTFGGTVNYMTHEFNQKTIPNTYKKLGVKTQFDKYVRMDSQTYVDTLLTLTSGSIHLNENILQINNARNTAIVFTDGFIDANEDSSVDSLGEEKEFNSLVRWVIRDTINTDFIGPEFIIPFGRNEGLTNSVYPFGVGIRNNLMDEDGYLDFSTYRSLTTDPVLPTIVDGHFPLTGPDAPDWVVNRFWYIGYPEGTKFGALAPVDGLLTFSYVESELNLINEDNNLMAQRFNSDSSTWGEMLFTQDLFNTWEIMGFGVLDAVNNKYKTGYVSHGELFNVWVITTGDHPLPIELISFETKCISGIVDIKWSTATETNNDFYTVEKSEDGLVWQLLIIISGSDNSSTQTNYHIVDQNPYVGLSYYRLKQTDNNGVENIISIITSNCLPVDSPNIDIYPNPFNDDFIISFDNLGAINVTIFIYDITGKVIVYRVLNDAEILTGNVSINLGSVADGIYFLKFITDQLIINNKITKLK